MRYIYEFVLTVSIVISKVYAWEYRIYPSHSISPYVQQQFRGREKYGFDSEHNVLKKLDDRYYNYPAISTQNLIKFIHPYDAYKNILNTKQFAVDKTTTATRTTTQTPTDNNDDASYSFSYDAGDSARQESSDSNGNVRGQYSYTDGVGTHLVRYIAGKNIGFKIIQDKLQSPSSSSSSSDLNRKLIEKNTNENQSKKIPEHHLMNLKSKPAIFSPLLPPSPIPPPPVSAPVSILKENNNEPTEADNQYHFGYNTDDSARQESSDENGIIQGSYSYKNEAGRHDLHYRAGPNIGFLVTGGSLAVPNGIDDGATVKALKNAGEYFARKIKQSQSNVNKIVIKNSNDTVKNDEEQSKEDCVNNEDEKLKIENLTTPLKTQSAIILSLFKSPLKLYTIPTSKEVTNGKQLSTESDRNIKVGYIFINK